MQQVGNGKDKIQFIGDQCSLTAKIIGSENYWPSYNSLIVIEA